jgi:hypothetical protein
MRAFWRRYVTRRWVFDIVVHQSDIPPIYGETMSGLSTLCILHSKLFVTLNLHGYKSITPYQKGLLINAHAKCYNKRIDISTYDKILADFLINQ